MSYTWKYKINILLEYIKKQKILRNKAIMYDKKAVLKINNI